MTRLEMSQRFDAIMNPLDDHANGMKPLSRSRAEELVELLDKLSDDLMTQGLDG